MKGWFDLINLTWSRKDVWGCEDIQKDGLNMGEKRGWWHFTQRQGGELVVQQLLTPEKRGVLEAKVRYKSGSEWDGGPESL
jgi:hypothetical protein